MKNISLSVLYTVLLFLSHNVAAETNVAQLTISDFNKGRVLLTPDNFKELVVRADSGDLDAMYMTSLCYVLGRSFCSVERSEKKYLKWLDKAAKGGQVNALFSYGMQFQFGHHKRKIDINKAVHYYEKAIENGYKQAQIALIRALAERKDRDDINKINNIIKDFMRTDKKKAYEESVKTYYGVLLKNLDTADNDINRLYFQEFQRWHRMSIEAGEPGTCELIGNLYYYTVGFVKKDEVMRNAWFHYCRKIGDDSYILKERVDDAKFSPEMKKKIDTRVKWLEDNFPEVYN